MASVRIFSSVARLAVMVATAPLANRICTVATSATSLCTEAPCAVSWTGVESTRFRMMSMSWIMRSITTVSFCTRGTNGPRRRDSIRIGDDTICLSSSTAPLKRSTWPTCRMAALGHREQLAGLLQRGRHGLFHQHADAGLQQVARHVEVLLGGHGHAGHVHAADEISVVAEGLHLVSP